MNDIFDIIIVYDSDLFYWFQCSKFKSKVLLPGALACIAFGKMQGLHRKMNHVCYDNVSCVSCPEWHLFKDCKKFEVTGPYPRLRLDTNVQRKCWIRLYKRYIVLHSNRLELQTQAYTRSLIQHFLTQVKCMGTCRPIGDEDIIKWLLFCISSPLIWAPKPIYRCLKGSGYATGWNPFCNY